MKIKTKRHILKTVSIFLLVLTLAVIAACAISAGGAL